MQKEVESWWKQAKSLLTAENSKNSGITMPVLFSDSSQLKRV